MNHLLRALAALFAAAGATLAQAQISADPFNTSPRGATQLPALRIAAPAAAPAPASVPAPMPPDPSTAVKPLVFGSQIFSGRFASEAFNGFNADYQLAIGDRVSVRMWGAFNLDAVLAIDPQGNVFIPNVGPVNAAGVRNGDLNHHVETQIKRVFRANVGVYATLEAAQPVKVYVTGFVRAPGLYGGLSSDSVLYFLDKAGGIDPERGSYLGVDVRRAGKTRAQFNLYRFLLDGQIEPLQLQDGDTVVVAPRQYTVQVGGEVLNPYIFEFSKRSVDAAELLAVARPRPGATHLSVVRKVGVERRSEYHPLADAARVTIEDGDEVSVTSDKYPGTILVRIEGAHLGERTLVLPYGSRLRDAMARLRPAPQANVDAVQLYRRSVATRQKELLETSLRSLETYALTARSATSEEAALRTREAELLMQYIERAKTVQPKGQVVLARREQAPATLLEDGDVIRVPEYSNLVLVGGEVNAPNALVFEDGISAKDYIKRAGGFTQRADSARLLVMHQDGSVAEDPSNGMRPGDEILVLPKIETKTLEITRGITQIIYQIAVAAKVLFDL